MKIALAQINSVLGDFVANKNKILDFVKRAQEQSADVVVFPEAALFGYHPMDLLERKSIVATQMRALKELERLVPPQIVVVLGAFTPNPARKGKPFFNSAVVIERGKKSRVFNKELLPTYDVFDDARHIEPGRLKTNILKIKNKKILITVCEDIWAWPIPGESLLYDYNPILQVRRGRVDVVLNLSASPYYTGKMALRRSVVRATAKHLRAPMVYVNMFGGQDELIFDGGSFAVNAKGEIIARAEQFCESLTIIDLDRKNPSLKTPVSKSPASEIQSTRKALVVGVRDFALKCGVKGAHLGLSGGVDSAVVACLATEALGRENVSAVAMPGPYNDAKSLVWAKQLADRLGIRFFEFPIGEIYQAMAAKLDEQLGATEFGTMQENLQARLRAVALMAAANKWNSLLLNTSNKSELASGYSTLYGDQCGGLAPIGDLLKSDVYALAELFNGESEVIPREIIERAPSAELRPNQKDQDTLPPYPELDASVIRLVELAEAARTASDHFLLDALMKSEFKRWQAPPILKVRKHSFGRGRRMPVAHRARV